MWPYQCEKSFQELKNELVNAPILISPNLSESCGINTVASYSECGCVQRRDSNVMGYGSRQLQPYKQKFPTYALD